MVFWTSLKLLKLWLLNNFVMLFQSLVFLYVSIAKLQKPGKLRHIVCSCNVIAVIVTLVFFCFVCWSVVNCGIYHQLKLHSDFSCHCFTSLSSVVVVAVFYGSYLCASVYKTMIAFVLCFTFIVWLVDRCVCKWSAMNVISCLLLLLLSF